jgi:hypothetical protein
MLLYIKFDVEPYVFHWWSVMIVTFFFRLSQEFAEEFADRFPLALDFQVN